MRGKYKTLTEKKKKQRVQKERQNKRQVFFVAHFDLKTDQSEKVRTKETGKEEETLFLFERK